MTPIDLAYRKTAVEGASGIGLLIALFDTLARDLQKAADAERANEIEKRSRAVNHALLVVSCLEDCVRRGPGGELADQLVAFYTNLRRNILQAQVKRSAQSLEQHMGSVLRLREAWQKADIQGPQAGPDVLRAPTGLDLASMQTEIHRSNWSA